MVVVVVVVVIERKKKNPGIKSQEKKCFPKSILSGLIPLTLTWKRLHSGQGRSVNSSAWYME